MGQLGQLFHFHRLGEISPQPGYCFRDAVHTGILEADLGYPDTGGTAEQTDQNLIDHEGGEQFSVLGQRHQLDQLCCRVEDVRIGRSDAHGTALLNPRQTVRVHLQDHFGDLVRIRIQPERDRARRGLLE